jgi:hypothetical protein
VGSKLHGSRERYIESMILCWAGGRRKHGPTEQWWGGRRDNRGERDKGVASWVARDGGWIRLGRGAQR